MTKLGPNQIKWIEALESGNYKQDKSFLCRTSSDDGNKYYCCLGVACELFLGEGIVDEYDFSYSWQEEERFAPPKIIDILALRSRSGVALDVYKFEKLIALNDDFNKSFKEIAQILRENPEQYFMESK